MMDVAEAIEAGRVQVAGGGAPEIVEAFGLFDQLDPAQNYRIPPLGS